MRMKVQKRLAGRILKTSKRNIRLDPDSLEDIKEAITKADIKGLIDEGTISRRKIKGPSRDKARKLQAQKAKGRRKGHGSRKGKATARQPKKEAWMAKIRLQRSLLKELRDKKLITRASYYDLASKAKGGFFRSKRHVKLFIQEQNLVKKNVKK